MWTKYTKLIPTISLTACGSQRFILQLSLEMHSSGRHCYRIVVGSWEDCWVAGESLVTTRKVSSDGRVCFQPGHPPPPCSFSILRPPMASSGDSCPRAGLGLDSSRFLHVSLANPNVLREEKPVLLRATPSPRPSIGYRNEDAVFKKEHRVSLWKI